MSQNVCYTFKGVNPFLEAMEALRPSQHDSHVSKYKSNRQLKAYHEATIIMDEWVKGGMKYD